MTSTAISAQNTQLFIGTGTGAANNITAITSTNPPVVTSNAHGRSNGDNVALAAIVGTMSAMNGNSYVVSHVTPNSFAIEGFDATGLGYTNGGTATPVTYTQIKNVKTYSGFDGAASEIDVTNLDSTAKEVRLGLQDFGSVKFDLNPDFADAGQNAARAAKAAAALKPFKLNYPNGKVASFSAYVKSMPEQGGVDAVIAGSVDLRISGSVVVA